MPQSGAIQVRDNYPSTKLILSTGLNLEHQDGSREEFWSKHPSPALPGDGATEKDWQNYQKAAEKFTASQPLAWSINIWGLNEAAIIEWWERCKNQPDDLFKGTRYMGLSRNPNSVVARGLKTGLPPGLKINIGVRFAWSNADVRNYALGIKQALAKKGIKQLD
ncbi:hypothetical protein [Azospirillum doebereinerae]